MNTLLFFSLTFLIEMLAFRVGAKLADKLAYDPHKGGHHHAPEHTVPALAPQAEHTSDSEAADWRAKSSKISDEENWAATTAEAEKDELEPEGGSGASQIIGVAVLEFGVIFHSVIIGLTLGSTSTRHEFNILFIVIIFHQMFEGLGLGVRLAFLPLKPKSLIPFLGAIAYSCVTPIGLAIGIGVRHTYNSNGATANYVEGTLDSISAGILAYTAFVELIAHDFVFNDKLRKAPVWLLLLDIFYVFCGAGLMALLAKWA